MKPRGQLLRPLPSGYLRTHILAAKESIACGEDISSRIDASPSGFEIDPAIDFYVDGQGVSLGPKHWPVRSGHRSGSTQIHQEHASQAVAILAQHPKLIRLNLQPGFLEHAPDLTRCQGTYSFRATALNHV